MPENTSPLVGASTRSLGVRKLAILRVLDTINGPATFDKVRARGVNLREWRTNSLLGENLRALANAGLVGILAPVIRAGVHVAPRMFWITADGRAALAGQGQKHASSGHKTSSATAGSGDEG